MFTYLDIIKKTYVSIFRVGQLALCLIYIRSPNVCFSILKCTPMTFSPPKMRQYVMSNFRWTKRTGGRPSIKNALGWCLLLPPVLRFPISCFVVPIPNSLLLLIHILFYIWGVLLCSQSNHSLGHDTFAFSYKPLSLSYVFFACPFPVEIHLMLSYCNHGCTRSGVDFNHAHFSIKGVFINSKSSIKRIQIELSGTSLCIDSMHIAIGNKSNIKRK